jgi:oxygen-independent coproporphyrinogen-3 oxidase
MDFFSWEKDAPVLVETSPRQTTKEKLRILKEHNTKRISIGVQSFQDKELSVLGRNHTVSECRQALSLIAQIGFPVRNMDFIYGIPGQDTASFQDSIDTALSYEPEELFLYPLYIKPGTMLYQTTVLSPEHTYELYQFMSPYLQEHGYEQISMRRFVRKDCLTPAAAFHGCGFENTLSLGCGARSYLENLHFCTPYHTKSADCLQEIQKFLSADYLAVEHGYLLSGEEMLRRYVIKNLLHRDGISFLEYETAREHCLKKEGYTNGNTGSRHILFEDFPVFSELLSDNLIFCKEEGIALTERGMSLSDAIGPLFISKEAANRMYAWRNL